MDNNIMSSFTWPAPMAIHSGPWGLLMVWQLGNHLEPNLGRVYLGIGSGLDAKQQPRSLAVLWTLGVTTQTDPFFGSLDEAAYLIQQELYKSFVWRTIVFGRSLVIFWDESAWVVQDCHLDFCSQSKNLDQVVGRFEEIYWMDTEIRKIHPNAAPPPATPPELAALWDQAIPLECKPQDLNFTDLLRIWKVDLPSVGV